MKKEMQTTVDVALAKEHPEVYLKENQGLIEKTVNKFYFDSPKFSRDDLVQEATLNAVHAIQKYNVDANASSLSTYIYSSMKRACRDFVRKNKYDLYITAHQQDKAWKTEKPLEKPNALRLDENYNTGPHDNGSKFSNSIPASGDLSVLNKLIKKEQASILVEEVNALSERERDVVYARFWDGKTLAEIANTQGCSRQRINIIANRALNKLTVKVKERLEDELFI